MPKEALVSSLSEDTIITTLKFADRFPDFFISDTKFDLEQRSPKLYNYLCTQQAAIPSEYHDFYRQGYLLGFYLTEVELKKYNRMLPFRIKKLALTSDHIEVHKANRVDLLGENLPVSPFHKDFSFIFNQLENLVTAMANNHSGLFSYLDEYLQKFGNSVVTRSYLYQGFFDGALPTISLIEAHKTWQS